MAFCGNCGAEVQDGLKFCQNCGQAAAATAQPVQPAVTAPPVQNWGGAPVAQPVQPAPAQPVPPPYVQQPSGPAPAYQPPLVPGTPGQTDIRDAQENKTMAILAYILFFIPLLTGAHKTSPFAKYHTNQGTVLFLASLALAVVLGILSAIITGIFSMSIATWGAALTVASIFGFIWMALAIVVTVFAVMGIINAAGGKMKPLPLIGRFTIIK